MCRQQYQHIHILDLDSVVDRFQFTLNLNPSRVGVNQTMDAVDGQDMGISADTDQVVVVAIIRHKYNQSRNTVIDNLPSVLLINAAHRFVFVSFLKDKSEFGGSNSLVHRLRLKSKTINQQVFFNLNNCCDLIRFRTLFQGPTRSQLLHTIPI
jgi:hypothetical protein